MKAQGSLKTKLRRDGSVRYFSVAQQQWFDAWSVPPADLAAMTEREAQRVLKHLQRTGKAKPCGCSKKKGHKHA